jgi:sugar lactone lactonase YvrE
MKRHVFAAASAASLMLLAAACSGGGTTGGHTDPLPKPTATAAAQGLWVANGTNVVEFASTQLIPGTSDPAPHLVLNSGVFGAPQGVVFDAAGDLWVIDGGTAATGGSIKPGLYKFTPSQLAAQVGSQTPATPSVAIGGNQFVFPQQAVFDTKGDLWVTDNGGNAVYEFTPSQLAATGTPTPTVTITANPALNGPLGIAFSPAGNLYIANNGGTTIDEFSASQIASASGAVTLVPAAVLSNNGMTIQAPWALAFDASGNLWSSNANAPNTLVKFAASVITTTGSPAAAVTLSPATVGGNLTLSSPNGIGFDAHGDLAAISSASPFGVAIFGASTLGTSGSTTTDFLVGATTTLNAPAGDTYGPSY